MQASCVFEHSWLLGLAPAQKDVVQQSHGIPKVQGLSNFGFWCGASHTERYSAEKFIPDKAQSPNSISMSDNPHTSRFTHTNTKNKDGGRGEQ